ncbi:topoisomerase DNA-binding C4 zinc finger domain-containing protein [Neobacillus drentensis]|uniref:topoisomerase DNA-binding C4 zinc finger domain-containing protein n=1 Tax=Neobacillus drentensis TaxID=220684 RepID=UPI002FFD7E54
MVYEEFEQADTEAGEEEYENEQYGWYLVNQLEYPTEHIFEEGRPMSETLYQGFCAEYHLIADLYRIGLEGTKPAADFGFDVMSTNFRKAVYENKAQETYLYQVKARYINKEDWDGDIGNRTVKKEFFIYSNDMLKLIMTKNSYLVLYLIEKESGRIAQYIWLSNYQLDNLLLSGKAEIWTDDKTGKTYFKLLITLQEVNYTRNVQIKDISLNNIHLDISNYNNRKTNIIEPTSEKERYPFDWLDILKLEAVESSTTDTCPKCGSKLVERVSKFGKFLGCKSYPTCKYKR